MASLRELTQTNPNDIVYDERTKQYHDIANRYRMVKRTVVEAMQNAIPTGAPTRNNDGSVSQTTFDAFRKDVYFHISETARLTKIGLEELKKSLDYQTKETNRLQRLVNQTDEDRQENKIERIYDERDIRSDRRRSRMSFGGMLGLGAGGLLGSFLLSSMFMSQEQIREFGESIDNVIGMLPDVENVIDNFNRISGILQSVLDFFTPENRDPNYGITGGGIGEGGTPQPPISPRVLEPRPQPSPLFSNPDAAALAAANPPPRPAPPTENAGDRMRAAAAASASRGTSGTPERDARQERINAERLYHERNEQRLIERTRGAPEIPEAVISRILFNSDALEQIRQMRAREGAYSGMQEPQIRSNIINMIASTLQGADRQFIAMAIRESIENHPDLHGSSEVAARIVQYSDEAGSMRAAENLYDIFFDRDVIGQRTARGSDLTTFLNSTRSQRSNQLRTRIRNFNSRRADLSIGGNNTNPNQLLPNGGSGGGVTVGMLPPVRNPQPQQGAPATPQTPGGTAPHRPIQNRNPDPTFAQFRQSLGFANA